MAYDPRTSIIHNVTGAQHVALHTLRTPDSLEEVMQPGWFDPLASPLGGSLQVNDRIWVAAGPDGAVRHADIVVIEAGSERIRVESLRAYAPVSKETRGRRRR